jgi:hypothetical protein
LAHSRAQRKVGGHTCLYPTPQPLCTPCAHQPRTLRARRDQISRQVDHALSESMRFDRASMGARRTIHESTRIDPARHPAGHRTAESSVLSNHASVRDRSCCAECAITDCTINHQTKVNNLAHSQTCGASNVFGPYPRQGCNHV